MKFTISGTMVVSCWCEVEAENEQEAKRLASQLDVADHHIDGSSPAHEAWHFDNDGTPYIVGVERS